MGVERSGLTTPSEVNTGEVPGTRSPKDPLAQLERALLARGLASHEDLNKARLSLTVADPMNSDIGNGPTGTAFLNTLVTRGVITTAQSERLGRELVSDTPKRIDIPGFQVLERIGRGCMGVVYKARQTSVDRIVAVKILLPSLAKPPSYVQRFVREAKMAAALSHPNLVSVIDARSANGLYYFVIEYVDGKTVGERLHDIGRFDEKEALHIALDVAEALQHAHEQGLIHRDVKPDNIMIHRDRAKLPDLGLARPTVRPSWAWPKRVWPSAHRSTSAPSRPAAKCRSTSGPTFTAWGRPSTTWSPAGLRSRARLPPRSLGSTRT